MTDQKSETDGRLISKESLPALAIMLGADKAAFVRTKDMNFSIAFKEMCAMNSCGKYNTNWMCPPAVGKIEDGIARIKEFEEGLVIQTISQLEDSFDFEGMQLAAIRHDKVFRSVIEEIRLRFPCQIVMALGAGGCSLCARCAYLDGRPCIQPEQAIASVEAYGVDVNNLLTTAGLKYNNGPATVSYVGLVLFKATAES